MKQKRKGQPNNLKRYWVIFSVLAFVLLIPFRIVGFWMLTNIIYLSIIIMIAIAVIRFVRQYGWKRWIVALMLVCVLLPTVQINQNLPNSYDCTYDDNSNGFIQSVDCNNHGWCFSDFVVLHGTSFGIQTKIFPKEICFLWGL